MNIKNLPVEKIDAVDRLRPINPVYVNAIQASFEARGGESKGQLTPIEVRRADEDGRYKLVAGAHRLEAAKASGWTTIAAVISDVSNDEARLREIDEDLVRHDLSELDRAFFMAERDAVWKQLNPDSVQGKAGASARWHAICTMTFASDAAEKLGVSVSTVERWLKLAKAAKFIGPEIRERIARTDLANNRAELLALANLPDDGKRAEVLDLIYSKDEDRPKKVKAAIARLNGVLPEHHSDDDAQFEAFKKVWRGSNKAVRDRIREFVLDAASPKSRARQPGKGAAS